MASEIPFPPSPPEDVCRHILASARQAREREEIPVAAGVYRLTSSDTGLHWDRLSLESNRTAEKKNPLAHAEFLALEEARQRSRAEYLSDCALITSLEPCLLCSGALLLSRIGAIYYFTPSDKGIRLSDVIRLSLANRADGLREGVSNHHPPIFQVTAFAEESRLLLEEFFRGRRALRTMNRGTFSPLDLEGN